MLDQNMFNTCSIVPNQNDPEILLMLLQLLGGREGICRSRKGKWKYVEFIPDVTLDRSDHAEPVIGSYDFHLCNLRNLRNLQICACVKIKFVKTKNYSLFALSLMTTF